MESISLLNQALSPYQVTLGPVDRKGERRLILQEPAGAMVSERSVVPAQLADKRLLVDLVDGFHRDLRIHEGRLDPSIIAALANVRTINHLASA